MRPRLHAASLALAILFLTAPPSQAQGRGGGGGNACTVSVTGVNFGSYNVFSGTPLDSTGSVSFTCGAAARNVRVMLSTGLSGGFNPRLMSNGADSLAYNLYIYPNATAIWGDETSGTSAHAWNNPPEDGTLTIYGRIPAGQDVSAGTYTDTVTAIIEF